MTTMRPGPRSPGAASGRLRNADSRPRGFSGVEPGAVLGQAEPSRRNNLLGRGGDAEREDHGHEDGENQSATDR